MKDLFLNVAQYHIKAQSLNNKGYQQAQIPNEVTATNQGKTWYLVYHGTKDVTGWKRVSLFIKSLAHIIFTLGIALKTNAKLKDHWDTALSGKKVREIFVDQQPEEPIDSSSDDEDEDKPVKLPTPPASPKPVKLDSLPSLPDSPKVSQPASVEQPAVADEESTEFSTEEEDVNSTDSEDESRSADQPLEVAEPIADERTPAIEEEELRSIQLPSLPNEELPAPPVTPRLAQPAVANERSPEIEEAELRAIQLPSLTTGDEELDSIQLPSLPIGAEELHLMDLMDRMDEMDRMDRVAPKREDEESQASAYDVEVQSEEGSIEYSTEEEDLNSEDEHMGEGEQQRPASPVPELVVRTKEEEKVEIVTVRLTKEVEESVVQLQLPKDKGELDPLTPVATTVNTVSQAALAPSPYVMQPFPQTVTSPYAVVPQLQPEVSQAQPQKVPSPWDMVVQQTTPPEPVKMAPVEGPAGWTVKFRNAAGFPVSVRVYEQLPKELEEYYEVNRQQPWGEWLGNIGANVLRGVKNGFEHAKGTIVNKYKAVSVMKTVQPGETVTFDMDEYAQKDRWIYYSSAANAATIATELANEISFNNVSDWHYEKLRINEDKKRARVVLEHPTISAGRDALANCAKKNNPAFIGAAVELRKANYLKQVELDQTHIPTVFTSNNEDISISENELKFWAERDRVTAPAIRALCDVREDATLPRIGMCSSGGGLRAETVLSGFMKGMTEEGLMDMVGCLSGTSGSTWAMADWLAREGDVDTHATFCNRTREAFDRGAFLASKDETLRKMTPLQLAERNQGEENPTSGLHEWNQRLFETATAGTNSENLLKPFYECHNDPSKMPLLIFNTMAKTKLVNWRETKFVEKDGVTERYEIFDIDYISEQVEMNEFDVTFFPDPRDRSTTPFWRVESRAFGRKFNDEGQAELTETTAVPPSLQTVAAVCGSAHTVDLNNLMSGSTVLKVGAAFIGAFTGLNLRDDQETYKSAQNKYSTEHTTEEPVKGGPTENSVLGRLFEGFPVTRPVPGRGGEKIYLRDAGIGHNLPMEALVRPSRGCDIAFVLDSSGDLNDHPGQELFKAMQNVKTFGRKLPEIFSDRKAFDAAVKSAIKAKDLPIVFGDINDPEQYCVVYIPTVKLNSKYDPMDNSTFKLRYNPKSQQKLHNHGCELAKLVAPELKRIIQKRTEVLNQQSIV